MAGQADYNFDFDLNVKGPVSATRNAFFVGTKALPPLPQKMSPSQAARLAEILDFLHNGLVAATENIEAKEDGSQVTLSFADWQKILAVEMLLARYLRRRRSLIRASSNFGVRRPDAAFFLFLSTAAKTKKRKRRRAAALQRCRLRCMPNGGRPRQLETALEFVHGIEQAVDGGGGMIGVDLNAQHARMVGHGGERHGLHIEAMLEQQLARVEGVVLIAHQDRDDRRLAS